jgi:hypothetical protein
MASRILLVLCFVFCTCNAASADVLFESGALGPTGVTWTELVNGTVPGINITSHVFNGVRFELTSPVMTTQVGGHFASPSGGAFFGSVVRLTDENDFPDSGNLSTPDVLGSTLIAFPESSGEAFGNLSLSLDPGWYVLVFGSGLFGATSSGGAVGNNPDIDDPTYIGWQSGTGWFNLSDLSDVFDFSNYRFVIVGSVVPEPTSAALILLLGFSLLHRTTAKIK